MNRKKKRKEKFANWLLDIAKYITTAVVISSIFEGIEDKLYYDYPQLYHQDAESVSAP